MATIVGKAPAKILLSGEHAVVYGMPAIALAVNRYATTQITSKKGSLGVFLHLCDLKKTSKVTLATLTSIKDRILTSYRKCLEGSLHIRDVLCSPSDLFHVALSSFLDSCAVTFSDGIHVQIESSIPVGCGMGSSAASTVSLLKALLQYFHLEKGLDWLSSFAQQIEHFQHGKSSGVDTYICSHGGCAQFQINTIPKPLPLPEIPLWLVHTGSPLSTTGESVLTVRSQFEKSSIWDEFKANTLNISSALQTAQHLLPPLLKENHKLLCRIGVVPKKIITFIESVENGGGAAKICGAGAVYGDAGGIVLVSSQHPPKELCNAYGYTYFPLQGELRGATAYRD